jgi:hypothetical protein
MKISAILFLLFTTLFSSLQACVTYNPTSGTYTVDAYGVTELSARKPKKPIPIDNDESGASRDRSNRYAYEGKPKIVKQPRPVDWDESFR